MRTGSKLGLLLVWGWHGWHALACSAPPAPVEQHAEEHQHLPPHEHAAPAPAPAAAAAAAAAGLTRIESGSVCMLSNRYLGDRQHVPVSVEGKTYYGCCANCAARLAERPDAREARDPLTGHAVDKGSAVLARDTENRVLYFESEETLAKMQRSR